MSGDRAEDTVSNPQSWAAWKRRAEAAEERSARLERELERIAKTVAAVPTVTGLQEACVKDHSLIWMAICDAQDTFRDTVEREQLQRERDLKHYQSEVTAAHKQADESREHSARLEAALREIVEYCKTSEECSIDMNDAGTLEEFKEIRGMADNALAGLSPAGEESGLNSNEQKAP